jgi:DNA ligase-1
MRYEKLAALYQELSSTTKRLKKTEILSTFLKHLDESDKEVLYLLLGKIYPEYDCREMGISTQLTVKAISKATGISPEIVVKEWRTIGDLGEVAEKLAKHKRQSTLETHVLTTKKVLDNLRKLPELAGKGTIDKKLSLITELLTSAPPLEAKYLVRTLLGDLRIGLKSSTIRDALAHAFFKEDDVKEAINTLQNAYDMSQDLAKIFEHVKQGKKNFEIALNAEKPIKVMLAQKAKSIAEAFEKVGKILIAEYKYDGFRMMIHKKGNVIKLYTRRLENATNQFPDIVEAVKKHVKGDSYIIDSEIIGYDPKTKEYLPFQAISQRIKRKYDIEKLVKALPVEVKVFDIIYYEGKSLINEPFKERTKFLKSIIKPEKYKLTPADQLVTDKEEEVREFYNKAIKNNQEGLMLKNLNAPYKPGSRVGYMLKLKEELRDFDLVIVGAEYGTGKRAGWLSSFILACKEGHEFKTIGKMGTGIKEKSLEGGGASFKELTKILKPLITKTSGREVEIKPKIVISVTFQEIQKSPTYSSGFALRFPRLTALRPDKNTSDITSLHEIIKEYKAQKKR